MRWLARIFARRKGHFWLSRPRWLFGGMGLRNIPAVPYDLTDVFETLVRLRKRSNEVKGAKDALSSSYTIAGMTRPALDFLFHTSHRDALEGAVSNLQDQVDGDHRALSEKLYVAANIEREEDELPLTAEVALTGLPLDDPSQFSISWTTLGGVHQRAVDAGLDVRWGSALTDPAQANEQFWPMIAEHGLGYNLLILRKVDRPNRARYEAAFPGGWPAGMQDAFAAGLLYVIDLELFAELDVTRVDGIERFTPATVTWLVQDVETRSLSPVAVRVSGPGGGPTMYGPGDAAWLWALQAAKVSVTVYGIWIGHVYHWHVVTAAMQMTMFNHLPDGHPIERLVGPQSKHLIAFDDVLIALWKHISPSTSLSGPRQFLRLCDAYAEGRGFFDDDPLATLQRFGILESDFTLSEAWDAYPIVGRLLEIQAIAEEYVTTIVDAEYATDAEVQADRSLRRWMDAAASPWHGNVRGLPEMSGKEALKRVAASLVYRTTVHGVSRLNATINPAVSFVGNFPPCLQSADIPSPDTAMSTAELLAYLPRTGTIGEMVDFYFAFMYSTPYEPLLSDRLFYGPDPEDPRNVALLKFRARMADFMRRYQPSEPQLEQWPLSIET